VFTLAAAGLAFEEARSSETHYLEQQFFDILQLVYSFDQAFDFL
jgi:hypothetical protein